MKKALITGITGQDGSYLAELLLEKDYEVHGIVRRSSSFNTGRIDHLYRDPHLPGTRLFLHYGDLDDSSSLNLLLRKLRPDEIYNLGAQSHVRVSFDVPEYTGQVTGIGAVRLLEGIREAGLTDTRLYQASSSEMFGSSPPPQNEDTIFHPRSPYGCAKVYAYWIGVNYRESYGLHVSNGILFNHECVTAETPVIVRRNGFIDILPIEEVVPHRTDPRHGLRYTTEPAEELEIWDRDRWTRVTCMTATWTRGDKRVIRVAARGAVFSATEDHVVILGDGRETKSGDVRPGDALALGIGPDATGLAGAHGVGGVAARHAGRRRVCQPGRRCPRHWQRSRTPRRGRAVLARHHRWRRPSLGRQVGLRRLPRRGREPHRWGGLWPLDPSPALHRGR